MTPRQTEPKCGRCGHPQGWHRHDDTTESDAFRCIGYDCWAPGPPKEPCGCPDYVEPRASATTSEPAAAPYCPHCGNGVLQEHVPGCPAASAVTP